MRIITEKGEFESVPEAELSRYNLLLSAAGDQTAPMTIPGTPNNLKLIGWSDRADAYYKPLTNISVTVIDSLIIRRCNLGVITADETNGISCTLYFEAGSFYSLIEDNKLNALSWPKIKHADFDAVDLTTRVQYIIGLMKDQYLNNLDSVDFRVIPFPTTQSYTWYERYPYITDTYDGLLVLNNFYNGKYFDTLKFDDNHNHTLKLFQGEFEQIIKENDAPVTLSLGYGMTPFLKLKYVLEFLFSEYGYSMDASELETVITKYPDIVVLNNVADAICGGILDYSQLVPDMTIAAFVSKAETLLSGKFFVDDLNKVVTFRMYEKYLTMDPDIDLSKYLASKLIPSATEFASITVVDTADTTVSVSAASDNNVHIEFSTPTVVTISETIQIMKTLTGTVYIPFDFTFKTPELTDIVNKNTAVVIDGVTTVETANSMTDLVLCEVGSIFNTNTLTQNSITYTVYFRQGSILFNDALKPQQILDAHYTAYKNFRKNSNIPLTADMNMPAVVLENLKIYVPKIVNNQKLLIEKIVTNTGSSSGVQKVTFRTLRDYSDRP